MKVLLVNGSPKPNGNTGRALEEVEDALNAQGIDTEIFQVGAKPIRDCIGCSCCVKLDNACTFDNDIVNDFIKIAAECDGYIFATPVYYAHPAGRILDLLDRAFYAAGSVFAHKPGASIAVARRAGTVASFDVLNKYFTINQMPIVSSNYWNDAFGAIPGEDEKDEEGMQVMRVLGNNMAWLLKCIEAGKAAGIEAPAAERKIKTNFIR